MDLKTRNKSLQEHFSIVAVDDNIIVGFGDIDKKSFEAVIQETIVQPDGEICLIVESTTEIYSNPLNSLHISEETELVGTDGKEIQIENLHLGNTVEVILKDSFVEETPLYYPTVYKIKVINN